MPAVTGWLRVIGLLNAAVWFGAAVFFTVAVNPAAASDEMRVLLGRQFFPYYSGAIGQLLLVNYLNLQVACSLVALVHLLMERVYLGKRPGRGWIAFLLALCCFAMASDFGLQPRLQRWHLVAHAVNTRADQRQAADHAIRVWTSAFQFANLFATGGLGLYLWRVANQANPTRFVSASKFRG